MNQPLRTVTSSNHFYESPWVARLDALSVMRDGAARYLKDLAEIKAGVARIDARTERIEQAQASQSATLDAIARRVAHLESVPLDTLRAILAEMGEAVQGADAGEVERRLKAKAAEFKALTNRLNRLSNDDPEVTRLRRTAAEALAGGRFAEADRHLAEAEARDLAGLDDLEALARQKRLSAAASRAVRAAAARLRTNPDAYEEAAAHYAEAARIAIQADEGIARELAHRRGLTLLALGEEFGRNAALEEAIEQFRSLLDPGSRKRNALDWARTQMNLGTVLALLGERQSGTSCLEAAVLAYRASLEEWTRERVPLDWATTQINLGNTLARLGERESNLQRLEEAVSAYRAALEERTRKRVPLEWAETQSNLGNVLRVLGERESGTGRLEEAVSAFRAALEERSRKHVPLEWAMTQMNLGIALARLAERGGGTSYLKEAMSALQAASEEWPRARVPLYWATTQHNLGTVFLLLGTREGAIDLVEKAVSAYQAALEERTQDRVPLDWAMSVGNQGTAIAVIALQRGDCVLARSALKKIEAARITFERASHAPHTAYYEQQAKRLEAEIERIS